MSLRLFLDEDSQAKRLVDLLRDADHDVLTVNEVGLVRKPDSFVLDYARQEGRLLLTRNIMSGRLPLIKNPESIGTKRSSSWAIART